MTIEVVFLGMNEAGEKTLQWLKEREDVSIEAFITEKENLDMIEELRPELVISSGFEHIVPEELIEVPQKGIVNLHPSYLPYNRGSHPYIWPIINDTPAGVSVHFMNENLDEGPIIARKEVEVRPDDTAGALRERLMKEQFQLFKNTWGKILREEAEPQGPELGNTHYRNDLDEISQIDLNEEMRLGKAIDLLRGLTYDGEGLATFEKEGERYSVKVEVEREGSN